MLNAALSRLIFIADTETFKRLEACKARFRSDIDFYLSNERRLFKDHGYSILLRRAKGTRLAGSDELWSQISAMLSDILFKNPEYFVKHTGFPYLKVLISLKAIETKAITSDHISKLQWIDDGLFVDLSKRTNIKLAHNIPLCVLSNISDLMSTFVEGAPQYALREVILALVDTYDYKHKVFTGAWRERIEHRLQRKVDLKRRYLEEIANIWSARNVSQGLSFFDDLGYTQGFDGTVLIGKKLSLTKWKLLVQCRIALYFYKRGLTSLVSVQEEFYRHAFAIRSGNHTGMFRDIASAIFKDIEKVKRSFQISISAIEDALIDAFNCRMSIFSAKDAAFQQPYKSVANERRRISRMALSKTTKNAYSEALLYYSVANDLNSRVLGVLGFHRRLKKLGVNDSTTRNFIKSFYNAKIWSLNSGAQYLHDMGYDVIPALTEFVNRLSANTNQSKLYNTVFKLLTSHIGGGDFNHHMLNDLLALNHFSTSFDDVKITSINHLLSLLYANDSRLDNIFDRCDELQIPYSKERDLALITGMRLIGTLSDYLNTFASPFPASSANTINASLGKLNVAIMPHNDLLGMLGAGVPGICIHFNSKYHREHIHPKARNLVVYDESRIFLWGLMVQAECGQWYLNNFQGALPSRYRGNASDLILSIHDVLSEVGNVYLLDFYFNSLSLCKGLQIKEDVTLKLPYMRFDVDQDDDGTLLEDCFFMVEGKKAK